MKSLRAIRESAGLTQKELGRAIGVGPSQLASIESGARRPSIEVAARLFDRLHLRDGEAIAVLHELAGLPRRDPGPSLASLPLHLDGQPVELLELRPEGDAWLALLRPEPTPACPEPTARRVAVVGLALVAFATTPARAA